MFLTRRSQRLRRTFNIMQENNKKGSVQNMVLYIFESVMAFLYLAMSFVLLFTKLFEEAISKFVVIGQTFKNMQLFLGILLGFYGIFRVYRAIRKFRNMNKESN